MSFGPELARLLLVLAIDLRDDQAPQRLLVDRVILLERPGRVETHAELALERLRETFLVPDLLDALRRHVLVDHGIDDLGADRADRVADVLGLHELLALLVDDLALIVRDVVVFEQLLADVEVVGLDLALRALDLARQHLALDRFVRSSCRRATTAA